MGTLDALHYEGNIIDQLKELERRLNALERTELSGVVGPTGATGATGATGPTGPAGPGSPAGAVEGDIVYFDAVPEAVVLNIGTATQLLQVNAGATAPQWVTAGAANLVNRSRTLWVPATECYNATDVAYQNQVGRGWTMIDAKECRTYGTFRCPPDYASTMIVNAIFNPGATGNVRVQLDADYGASGEAYNTHSASQGPDTEAVVNTQIDQMSTSISLAAITTADYVLLKFTRDGTDVLDTITNTLYFMGFLVSYIADM